MSVCIRKRVVHDMSCKRFQFFVNVEALIVCRLLIHTILPYLFISADIISCVEFNSNGELLATGDKGGRVVIFQRAKVIL